MARTTIEKCDSDASAGRRLARAAVACAAATGVVVCIGACVETSLNEAPIVDRTTRSWSAPAPAGTAAPAAAGATAANPDDFYTVQKGDTLFHIASLYRIRVADLSAWNGISDSTPISVGQRLRVRATPGVGAASPGAPVAAGDAAAAPEAETSVVPIPINGAVESHALETLPAATAPVAPTPTVATPAAAIAAPPVPAPVGGAGAAGSAAPAIAGAAVAGSSAPAAPAAAPSLDPGRLAWIWPVDGRVVQGFDAERSKGIDIGTAEDAKVVAVADGEVTYTGSPRDFGNLVILRHPDSLLSVYAHNKSVLVSQGQVVSKGQAIATAGPAAAGAPFHFEVRRKGVPVNPLDLLPVR